MIRFFVHGAPVAQPRVRACIRGRHAGVYDPGTATAWKKKVAVAAKKHIEIIKLSGAEFEKINGPVSLFLAFNLPRPQAHYRANGELKTTAPVWHTSRPDLDNMAKAIMDAITDYGCVWRDDSQVCSIMKTKKYVSNNFPVGVEIVITKI
jgi:Holliday junction resolvase RusA-like endonuclease